MKGLAYRRAHLLTIGVVLKSNRQPIKSNPIKDAGSANIIIIITNTVVDYFINED